MKLRWFRLQENNDTRTRLDVWFDSGSTVCTMALSFENKKIDQNQDFQLILLLKVDQTRGWFYTFTLLD
jgi:isoleucyl-tRNA synthetase